MEQHYLLTYQNRQLRIKLGIENESRIKCMTENKVSYLNSKLASFSMIMLNIIFIKA